MAKQTYWLTKNERKFMHSAVVLGWKCEDWNGDNRWYWHGDVSMPQRVGPMAWGLVAIGLLFYCEVKPVPHLRATALGMKLECRAAGCCMGELLDGNDNRIGKCQECAGTGLLNSIELELR